MSACASRWAAVFVLCVSSWACSAEEARSPSEGVSRPGGSGSQDSGGAGGLAGAAGSLGEPMGPTGTAPSVEAGPDAALPGSGPAPGGGALDGSLAPRADAAARADARGSGDAATRFDADAVVAPSCDMLPAATELVGWATQNGGTTGGGNTPPVVVSTAAAFMTNISGAAARTIHLTANLTGTFSIGSNKTIVGLCGASLRGHVSLSRAANVIVRNLTIIGYNCTDSPSDCSGGDDAVTIGDGSHNVWFDHCDVFDGSDGNLDVTSGADFVTVSWTKFHYSSARTDVLAGVSGHRFSNLVGSADDVPEDVGHLNVTFHHDWWADHVDQRMPRTRNGKIHVFNNLFTSAGNSYCTNAGFQASLLVENNIYRGVNNPLQPNPVGDMLERGNVFDGTTGNKVAAGVGFTPPYAYSLDPTTSLATTLIEQVGPH